MFLHLSASHSVHRRGVGVPDNPLGTQPPPGHTPLGRHPHEMATEVGGMHPIEMHSCKSLNSSEQPGLYFGRSPPFYD